MIESLREDIVTGRLKVGDRLPTRAEMRTKYGIAAMTAARVVSALVDEGLAVSDVGRGVFVTAVPAEAPADTDPLRQLEARVRTLEKRVDQLSRREG